MEALGWCLGFNGFYQRSKPSFLWRYVWLHCIYARMNYADTLSCLHISDRIGWKNMFSSCLSLCRRLAACPLCEIFILRTPWGNFFKFDTNIHLHSRINWLEFGGQRPRPLWPYRRYFWPLRNIHNNSYGNYVTIIIILYNFLTGWNDDVRNVYMPLFIVIQLHEKVWATPDNFHYFHL